MSQMPDSIYLHKDDKYNNLGWYHAESENTILAEHDYDESVMEDYVEYTPVYRLEEAVRKAEKDLALTWEDMKTIFQIIATSDWSDFGINGKLWSDEFYEEVLKRFKEEKK